MKAYSMSVLIAFSAMPVLAQDSPLPYHAGPVADFLKENAAQKRPSVVLYNFNAESG